MQIENSQHFGLYCCCPWYFVADHCVIYNNGVHVNVWQSLWRSRIFRYFQNARARRDHKLQIVIAHKKSKCMTAGAVRPRLQNDLPDRPAGETDDTIASQMRYRFLAPIDQ